MVFLIVFLHGSGSSGFGISSLLCYDPLVGDNELSTFRNLCLQSNVHVSTPTCKSRHYTPQGGISSVWFDRSADFTAKGVDDVEDAEGVDSSWKFIIEFIDSVHSQYEAIIIGGNSMGGGLVLSCLDRELPANVIGFFTCGSFISSSSRVLAALSSASVSPTALRRPLFMLHVNGDPFIKSEWGKHTANTLSSFLTSVKFQEYDGNAHIVTREMVIIDISLLVLRMCSRNLAS